MSTLVVRHESELGWWEMVRAAPHPSLRPHVRAYVGWFEHMAAPLCRRELPTEDVPVIINFGAPVRVFDPLDPSRWTDYGSFTTGAFDSYVLVGSAGPSGGLQINLSIMGARLFLNRPLGELRNRAIGLEDLLGRDARRLTMELYDARTWEERFAILDREFAARILAARAPSAAVLWASVFGYIGLLLALAALEVVASPGMSSAIGGEEHAVEVGAHLIEERGEGLVLAQVGAQLRQLHEQPDRVAEAPRGPVSPGQRGHAVPGRDR